ncbi:MAG: zinc-ribbon domain containing protein [Bacteroidota bacterium]
MTFADKTLVCRECHSKFVFSAGEQEFYAAKGLTHDPTRCKACRQARKAANDNRALHEAVCAACGRGTRVPFQPRTDRPVYCRDCYIALRA